MAPPSIHRLVLVPMLALCFAQPVQAARIALRSAEASFQSGASAALQHVINGGDAAKSGWSVKPHIDQPQSIVFQTETPVQAVAFDVTLCFLSGEPGGYAGEFTLSYTTDPQPSLGGVWQPVKIDHLNSVGPKLEQVESNSLRAGPADTMIGDAVFEIRVEASRQAVTGFRLDVAPFWVIEHRRWQVAYSNDGDFCLTQFRVDAIQSTTTNLALGCAVTASHPLWADVSPAVLTDGLPGSFAHPARLDLGRTFFFEIDLGFIRHIDHLALRSRADGYCTDRMSCLVLDLYDRAPKSGGEITWEARDRADGSHPAPGEIDIVHAADGKGRSHGRYLRIFSESGVALSPQLAEVEAYGTLTPKLVAIRADGRQIPLEDPLSLPVGAETLSFVMAISGDGAIDGLPILWRLRGFRDDWQISRNLVGEVPQLRPGKYQFEAHAGHSDGEWDASILTLPVSAPAPFWRTPLFSGTASAGALGLAAFAIREASRRRHTAKIAALEFASALANERTRIARDMHDEVGARLSQLAVMQDLALDQHALPDAARERFQRVADTARLAVAALDEVVWAVAPHNDTLPSLVEYLGVCAMNYLRPLEIRCRVDSTLEMPPLEVRAHVRHQVALAFKEALQNIAKHSAATEVFLSVRRNPGQLVVCLSDNGSGLPADPLAGHRNGMQNMDTRLASIGGSCEARRRPEGGSEVELRIPLPS